MLTQAGVTLSIQWGLPVLLLIAGASAWFSWRYHSRLLALAGAVGGALIVPVTNLLPDIYGRKLLPRVDALQSSIWPLHELGMLTSCALFALASIVAGAYILRRVTLLIRRKAAVEDAVLYEFERLNWRLVNFGFPLLTASLSIYMYWAQGAWNHAWVFERWETIAFGAWIMCAAQLHLRLVLRIPKTLSIALSVLAFILSAGCYTPIGSIMGY